MRVQIFKADLSLKGNQFKEVKAEVIRENLWEPETKFAVLLKAAMRVCSVVLGIPSYKELQ